jgi:hypothetical protein
MIYLPNFFVELPVVNRWLYELNIAKSELMYDVRCMMYDNVIF